MKIVNYDNKVGKYILPLGFKELLINKSIEEQLKHYKVSNSYDNLYSEKDYSKRSNLANVIDVLNEPLLESIVVDNGIVVGINLNTQYGILVCFAEQGIIVSDVNGVISRKYLICVK